MIENIREAIKSAFTSITNGDKEAKETTKEETSETSNEETSNEETEETKEVAKSDDSKNEDKEETIKKDKKVTEALQLYDILNDPDPKNVGAALSHILKRAKAHGIEIEEDASSKEQKEATKDVLQLMMESMPEENRELITLLEPALRAMIKAQSEGNELTIKQLQKKLEKFETATEYEKFTGEVQKILSKPKYKDHLPQMEKLMEKITPADGISQEDYFDTLLEFASAKSSNKTKKENKEKKIEQNLEESVPSSRGKGDDVVIMDRHPNLQESIRAAQKGQMIKVQQ